DPELRLVFVPPNSRARTIFTHTHLLNSPRFAAGKIRNPDQKTVQKLRHPGCRFHRPAAVVILQAKIHYPAISDMPVELKWPQVQLPNGCRERHLLLFRDELLAITEP